MYRHSLTQLRCELQLSTLLVSLEILMSEKQRQDPRYFPRWLHWYQPQEDEEGRAENGFINGVSRVLDTQLSNHMDRLQAISDEKLLAFTSTIESNVQTIQGEQNLKMEHIQSELAEIKQLLWQSRDWIRPNIPAVA